MHSDIVIQPCDLEGRVQVPLSKSLLHRSLICAAMAGDLSLADLGEGVLSDDITATKECLENLLPVMRDQGRTTISLRTDFTPFA